MLRVTFGVQFSRVFILQQSQEISINGKPPNEGAKLTFSCPIWAKKLLPLPHYHPGGGVLNSDRHVILKKGDDECQRKAKKKVKCPARGFSAEAWGPQKDGHQSCHEFVFRLRLLRLSDDSDERPHDILPSE
jgi:hypothetical protein